jgi:hypothetical protein
MRAVHQSIAIDSVGGCLINGGDTLINNLINLMRANQTRKETWRASQAFLSE